MSLVAILVTLLLIALVWWAVNAILGAFGVGEPIATVVRVVFVIVVVLWLLSAVLGVGPGLRWR
jgi:hypothetical protein